MKKGKVISSNSDILICELPLNLRNGFQFLYTTILFVICISFFVSCKSKVSKDINSRDQRPNIVFILSDDHAYQAISSYGFGLNKTPNIDSIANQGILFKRAFVNNSLCAPSRASIISGKFSNNSSVKVIGDIFDGSQTTFPKQLQKVGYETSLFGKWHLYSKPTGFDFWKILPGQGDYYQPDFIDMEGDTIRAEGYVTNLVTDYAIDWLENKRDKNKPFATLIWNKAPHRNWMPETKYLNMFDSIKIREPETLFDNYLTRTKAVRDQEMQIDSYLFPNYDLKLNFDIKEIDHPSDRGWLSVFGRLTEEEKKNYEDAYLKENEDFFTAQLSGKNLTRWKYQRYIKDYLRTVQTIDDNVGRVMSYLRENDLEENTIIIYMSDQGFYLGEHGWFDKRFMYEESQRTPLIIRWPQNISPGRISMDLVMNLDVGPTLLEAVGADVPDDMEGQSFYPLLGNNDLDNWRDHVFYQYYASDGTHNVAKHIGVRSDKYKLIFYYENNDWELYDLVKDPNELNNVYKNKEYQDILKELKSKLKSDALIYEPDVKIENEN